ncbi:SAM-dependent methyltransferase [Streptomyces sp. NPDC050161]|uniref:SAM-dependent methyltransferase n=1 Tax=Streptomyces sp. NPDC050161 TaxID=3365604 RepID=UPI00379D0EA4
MEVTVENRRGPELSGADVNLGQDRAHNARMYDYYLGGKTNYAVDREAAREVMRAFPAIETVARANRAYMHRVMRFLARQGVRQFIDVGAGMPAAPNVHQVVQEVAPDCRVVYVDNDPIVLVYADSLLCGAPQGQTAYVDADATKPADVLAAVRDGGVVDFDRPVALSLHALLHFVPDEQSVYELVGRFMKDLPTGSFLSLSHCTGDFMPDAWQAVVDAYARQGTPMRVRSRTEVARFFDGLVLVEPGVTVAHRWHPEAASGPSLARDAQVSLYAGLARKP